MQPGSSTWSVGPIEMIETEPADRAESVPQTGDWDRALIIQTCANCGARMIERKCKLICTCGYFMSCSDYY